MTKKHLVLSYFLPQFHECPYNNKWWGKGFTEWNNVRVAQPLKTGHYQPRIPADGYYDLVAQGEIERQFANAKAHGIDGFVFYHYWYKSERPLGKPLDMVLANPDLAINFSLCWANHSWTRSWKNRRGSMDVLIEQTYGDTAREREQHYAYLAKAFADPRYIRVDGKPLFQIYIPEDIPDLQIYIDGLRSFIQTQNNCAIHISATVRNRKSSYQYLKHFDSLTLAQPTVGLFSDVDLFAARENITSIKKILREKTLQLPLFLKKLIYTIQDRLPKRPTYYDYDKVWQNLLSQTQATIDTAPIPINYSAFIEFDNTPRYRNSAKVIEGFTPDKFQCYLTQLVNLTQLQPRSIMFINAWNEWGEGMHLEGDEKYPVERLQALRRALDEKNK